MANNENLNPPWKAGQSGNLKGKPKGTKCMSTILREMLEIKQDVIDAATGKKRKKKIVDIIVQKLLKKATKGDLKAIAMLFDRTEGRAIQQVDLKGDLDMNQSKIDLSGLTYEQLYLLKHGSKLEE